MTNYFLLSIQWLPCVSFQLRRIETVKFVIISLRAVSFFCVEGESYDTQSRIMNHGYLPSLLTHFFHLLSSFSSFWRWWGTHTPLKKPFFSAFRLCWRRGRLGQMTEPLCLHQFEIWGCWVWDSVVMESWGNLHHTHTAGNDLFFAFCD